MDSKCNGETLDSFLPFLHYPTQENLKKVAEKELKETEDLREKCLSKLKRLIKDHHVTCVPTDDFLLRFLRCQEFRVEKALETLRNYSRFRVSIHERIMDLKPEIVKKCFDLKILGSLPYRNSEGVPLAFARPGLWNPGVCSFEELQTVTILLINYFTENEFNQVVGIGGLYDTKDVPISLVIRIIPYLNFWRHYLLECVPGRYQVLHLIIAKNLRKFVLPLILPLTPKYLREKFRYYDTGDQLCENISLNILPEEYGGNLGQLNNDYLNDVIMEHLHKMKDEQRHFVR